MAKTVRLTKAHRHAGRDLSPGAQLVLDERRAAWLVEQGVAEYVGGRPTERAALLTTSRATAPATEGGDAQGPAVRATSRPWGCCGGNR